MLVFFQNNHGHSFTHMTNILMMVIMAPEIIVIGDRDLIVMQPYAKRSYSRSSRLGQSLKAAQSQLNYPFVRRVRGNYAA